MSRHGRCQKRMKGDEEEKERDGIKQKSDTFSDREESFRELIERDKKRMKHSAVMKKGYTYQTCSKSVTRGQCVVLCQCVLTCGRLRV